MSEITKEEKRLLQLFITDVNTNTVNMNREINQLNSSCTEMIRNYKSLSDSINMNRVRAGVLREIKDDILKTKPKNKALIIIHKIDKYLFEDYNF